MLQRKAVEPATFILLEELINLPFLGNFNLVGGTALALQLGHRISVDLDFFNVDSFDIVELRTTLNNHFGKRINIVSSERNKLGIFGFIENVKIDICKHPFPLLNKPIVVEGIRMWTLTDIAASKVYAISNRGTRKDFWDLDLLLDHFSFYDIASFYEKRYGHELAISIAKMLTYFDSADESDDPVCLLNKNWEAVKKSIFKKINEHTK
jgi:predicted nucleotidyltransferase component of viral defense system